MCLFLAILLEKMVIMAKDQTSNDLRSLNLKCSPVIYLQR